MARELELSCPSGLRLKLRSMKGKDLDGLRDKRRVQTGEAISKLLNDCTVEILERSIYSKEPNFTWADALVGDRMHAMLGLRGTTSGQEYDFRLRCSDSTCRQMIDWSVNLDELDVQPLSEASKQIFMAGGNLFEATAGGKIVKFRLSTGRDQIRMAKFAQTVKDVRHRSTNEGRTLLGLAARIVSVEGVDDVMAWLDELDLGDITQLIRDMDSVDCGVETTIEIVCSGENGCGLKQEVELPLDSSFFLRAS